MERFESVIDDVKDMGVLVYADPVENAHKLEIWVKSGKEEYLYKFIGPGVRVANFPMFDNCLDLAKENEKLKEAYEKLQQENTLNKKTADTWSKECHSLYTKIDKLQEENEKLKKELHSFKQEKSKIPMVDDCLKLSKEIEKLTFENAMLKKGNEKFKKVNERLLNENQDLKKELKEIQEAFPMAANKILYGEGELKVENKDTDRVDKVLVDVDRFDSLLKENKKLKQLKEENKKLNDRIENLVRQNTNLKEENEALLEGDHRFIRKHLSEALMENKKLKEENEELKKDLQYLCARILAYIENYESDNEPLTRAGILDQAKKCVCGQREQDYGTPESNFQLIADLWNGYLGFMDHPQDQIRATDVSMMMALMKIARIRNGGGSGDSFVDLAGYAACGGEIWNGERHTSN